MKGRDAVGLMIGAAVGATGVLAACGGGPVAVAPASSSRLPAVETAAPVHRHDGGADGGAGADDDAGADSRAARVSTGVRDVVGVTVKSKSQGCARTRGGQVWCWNGRRPGAFRVDGPAGVTSVRRSEIAWCALGDGGAVWCWAERRGFVAEVVEGIPPATALVSDTDCVRAADEVWCEKSTAEGRTYRKIAGLSGIRDVVGRESQVCALLEDGRVLCWGQVGRKIFYDNTPPGHHPSLWMPGWRSHEVIREKPSALRGARGLAALAHMRCGRTKRGGVVVIEELCRNSQCGSIARAVPKLRDVVSVVESGSSICVVRLADGSTVEVTGRSFRPDASMPPVSKVRAPTSEPAEQWRGARRIEATIHVACALFEHGVFRCRSTDEGAKLEPVPGLGTVVDFDVETDGGCAVLDDGTLRCWQVDVRGKLSGVRDPTVRG